MHYIGVGWRALAIIIDTVLLGIVAYGLASWAGTTTEAGFELEGGPLFLMVLITFLYYILFEGTLGATPGKLALGLRVVKVDGSPISWQASIIRNVMRLVDGLVLYLVAAILIWLSPQRQRLGDRLADTVVIRPAK